MDIENLDMFLDLSDVKVESDEQWCSIEAEQEKQEVDLSDTDSETKQELDQVVIDWENLAFDWTTAFVPSTVDGEFDQQLSPGYCVAPSEVMYSDDPPALSPSSHSSTDEVSDVASKSHVDVMRRHRLTDDSLSDMTIKSLQRLCGKSVEDFQNLKTYRRTCLNRHYARSSRNKQHQVTTGLASKLKTAESQIEQLKKTVLEKESEIRVLQLQVELQQLSRN